jgi:hypothetical protein
MAKLVTETDAEALQAIRDELGGEAEFDFSYGFLVGVLRVRDGLVHLCLSSRTDDNEMRGCGLSLAGWLAAIREPWPSPYPDPR